MTSSFALRVANLQDAPAIDALLAACYTQQLAGAYDPEVLASALPYMTRANPRLLTSGTYYIAAAGAQLIGCGGWSREAPGSSEIGHGTAHVRHVGTHPNWLRRGIGRALLLRCFEEAALTGVRHLDCHSTLVAVEFYLAAGFKIVEPCPMKLAADISIDGVLLRREIDTASAGAP